MFYINTGLFFKQMPFTVHAFPLTISYHQFQFLIGYYSVAEIWYFIQKRNENDKSTNFLMKTDNKNAKKVYVNTK